MNKSASYSIKILSIFIIIFAISFNGYGANISGVTGPNIDPNDRSIQFRVGFSPSDVDGEPDEWAYRLHYQHAFNDTFRARIVTQFDKDTSTEYSFARAELLYNFKKAEDGIWSSAFRFELRTRRGHAAEEFAINWANQWELSPVYRLRGAFIVATDFNADVTGQGKLQSRFQLTRKLANGTRIGIEMFNNYGQSSNLDDVSTQRHQIGPSIQGSIWGLKYHARYLAGIGSRAKDHSFLLRFTKGF